MQGPVNITLGPDYTSLLAHFDTLFAGKAAISAESDL